MRLEKILMLVLFVVFFPVSLFAFFGPDRNSESASVDEIRKFSM